MKSYDFRIFNLEYRTRRGGFTLVEMLAAVLLTMLLTTSLVGVLRAINQQRKLTTTEQPLEGWKLLLRQRLLTDLTNSRRMRVTNHELILVGYGGRDASTGVPTHRPCEVAYRVESLAGRNWLIRYEIPFETRSTALPLRELVSDGIQRIRVARLEDDGTEAELILSQSQRGELVAVPTRLRCSLLQENGSPVVECVFFQPRSVR